MCFCGLDGCITKLATSFIKRNMVRPLLCQPVYIIILRYKAASVFSKNHDEPIFPSNALFVLQLHLGVHKPSVSTMR